MKANRSDRVYTALGLSPVDIGPVVKPDSRSVAIHGLGADFAEFGLEPPKLSPPLINHVV